MSYVDCVKCGNYDSTSLVLVKVYHANLCTLCSNDWFLFIIKNKDYREFAHLWMWLKTRKDMEYDEAESALESDIELGTKVFYIADKWVKDKIVREKNEQS